MWLYQTAQKKLCWHAKLVDLVYLVYLVGLVYLVHLVCFVA